MPIFIGGFVNKIFLRDFNMSNISSTIYEDSTLEIIDDYISHYQILLDGDEIISVPKSAVRDVYVYYCKECGTFAISDNSHGKIKRCECGKLGVDRTDYYTRIIGDNLPTFNTVDGRCGIVFNLRTMSFLDDTKIVMGILSKNISIEELDKYYDIFKNKFDK